MQITLDISQAAYKGTGVGRYVHDLTFALLSQNSKHNFNLFAGVLRKTSYFHKLEKEFNHKVSLVPLPPKVFKKLASLPLKLDFLFGNPDLLHTSDWAEPTTACKKVTTVHDLVFKIYPETVDEGIRQAQETRLNKIVSSGTHIIADSLSTKNDLMRIYKLKDHLIDVVYPGINPIYKPANSKEIDSVKTKFNLSSPYILSVGTKEPRKNLSRVIEAYQTIVSQKGWEDLKLVLVGNAGWGKDLNVPNGVINLGFVEDQDLVALYSGASVFVYPSLYEGFGYPVLEAMACGTPVVTSNVSSLKEIGEGACVLVDPNDVLDITSGIIAARVDKDNLVKKGYERVKKFSWANSATQILEIYERIVHEHSA